MLKKLLIIGFISLALPEYVYSQDAEFINPNNRVYHFVYSLSAMNANSINEAYAVTKILAEHIKKKNKRIEKIEIIICQNETRLLDQINKGFELVIISTPEFMKYQKRFNFLPAFTNQTGGSVGFNYLLVVNRDDDISGISQLKGSELNIQAQSTLEIPEMLLDKLLKEEKLSKANIFFSKITKFPSTNNAVLPVFFKKAKAAMVTEQALNIMSEINPQIEKQLKIIYRSPSFIHGVSCFNGNTITPENKEIMTDLLLNLHNDAYGRQLLNLFTTDKVVPYKAEYLTEFIKILGR